MPQKMQLKVLLSDAEKVVTISDGGLFLDVSSIQMFDANGAAVIDAGVVVTVGISADGLSYQSKVASSNASLGGFEFRHIKVSVSGRTTASTVVVDVKVCSISEAMTSDSYKSRLVGLFTTTPYTAATLPDPATLAHGVMVRVEGVGSAVSNGKSLNYLSDAYSANNAGTPLSYFRSADAWVDSWGGATITYENDVTAFGGQVMKAVINTSDVLLKKTVSPTFSVSSGSVVRLVMNIADSPKIDAGTLTARLRVSSDLAATKNMYFQFVADKMRNNGDIILTAIAGETGTTDYNGTAWTVTGGEVWGDNYNQLAVELINFDGVTVKLKLIEICQPNRPILTFTTDSPHPSILNVIAKSFARHGWSAGACIDADLLAYSAAMFRSLRDNYGWDIGTQGIGHKDYFVNPSALPADLAASDALFAESGFAKPNIFAYPLNKHSVANDVVLANAGFVFRRGRGNDITHYGQFGASSAGDSIFRCGQSAPLGKNLAAMKNRIDAVCATGGVLSLFTHSSTTNSADWTLGVSLSEWHQLVEYIALKTKTHGLIVAKPSAVPGLVESQISSYI